MYPELKISGGNIKSRKNDGLNLKSAANVDPSLVLYQRITERTIPRIIVYDVSCPIDGLYFSLRAATMKKKSIMHINVT